MAHGYGIKESFLEEFENEPVTEESLTSWWFSTMKHIVCPEIGHWYSFKIDNAKRRLGCCNFTHKVISISRNYFECADKKSLMNTLLHELAHAYAFEMDGERGHGIEWRWHMAMMGMSEDEITRTANEEVDGESLRRRTEKHPGKWEAFCPKCDVVCAYRWRLVKNMRNAMHSRCKTAVVWRELC